MYTSYPISRLQFKNISTTDEKTYKGSYFEIVTDDYGNGSYVNKNTTVESFFDFLISSHAIFNKIDDVFNERSIVDINESTNEETYRYIGKAYISGQTYFKDNPKSNYTADYEELYLNETVKKQQLDKFVHDKCLEVRALDTTDTAVQFCEDGFYKSLNDEENPRIDILSLEKFAKPHASCEINRGPNYHGDRIPYWHSGPLSIYSNAWATIFGKIKMPDNISNRTSPYSTTEIGFWVGIMSECGSSSDKRMIAISELHNIDEDNKIAYFSFQIPMGRDTNYYVVTPFEPGTSLRSRGVSNSKYKLFKFEGDSNIYVLVENHILGPFTLETIPPEIIDAIATEEMSEGQSEDEYDMFSNIDENFVAIMYYSPTAKEVGEKKTKWTLRND